MLLTELRRAIFHKGFLIATGAVFVMYYIDGRQALDECSSVITHLDLIAGVGAFTWLLPCVGVLCYAGSFIKENESGYVKYRLMRSGLGRYILSKCAAVAISALLATCIAIALYALYTYSICGKIIGPEHIECYVPYADSASFYIMIANGQYIAYILLHIALRGMAAGLWALGGLMLSTVWQNIYVALFSPAIIVYFKDYVWAAFSFHPTITLKLMEIGEMYIPGIARPLGFILAVFTGISATFTLLTYISLKRRMPSV